MKKYVPHECQIHKQSFFMVHFSIPVVSSVWHASIWPNCSFSNYISIALSDLDDWDLTFSVGLVCVSWSNIWPAFEAYTHTIRLMASL